MLTQKQIEEIREHLNRAQNPIFFFDNDSDGLCSFLLLQRYIGRGKGVPIRSFPGLTIDYFRKVRELNSDYVFILDKPIVSEEFLKEVEQLNLPVVWIDHHEVQSKILDFVNYYNPVLNHGNPEAVAAFCYQITKRKEDLWIAVAGCVADYYFPDFYEEFKKKYPDLAIDSNHPFDIYYGSQIGKISMIFNFALKDKTTNVINMLKFLMKIKSPYDIFEESNKNYSMHKRFKEIGGKYNQLLNKAIENVSDKLLFFKYGGDLSISCELANALKYKYPKSVIVIGYVSEEKINISVRGERIREIVLKLLKEFEDSTGGGHLNAIGVRIKKDDWDKFKERLTELVKDRKI